MSHEFFLGVSFSRHTHTHTQVTFTIKLKRRSTFYIVNLIAPCALLFFISFLGFCLPVDSGDKVDLEITIVLAMVVFQMVVTELLPPTPDAIPLLGKLNCILIIN